MPAPEILRIVATVGLTQMFCDLFFYWRIFSQEPYTRALERLGRLKYRLESTQTKNSKKSQRYESDYKTAVADVARRHLWPTMLTSAVFLILMRVLGSELRGQVLGVLPFVPIKFLRRITSRGLEFDEAAVEFEENAKVNDVGQAVSFTFIYMLAAMSVKFYVGKLCGTKPPKGAESVFSFMETPQGQRMMKQFGIDPDELKMD